MHSVDDYVAAFGGVAVIMCIMLFAALYRETDEREKLQAAAIERGYAEWGKDPVTGARVFKWKEPAP